MTLEDYREGVQSRLEELSVMNAKQSSELMQIKESVEEIKLLVKEQNGRVRALERETSGIKAVGSVLSVVFVGFISWLFKMK